MVICVLINENQMVIKVKTCYIFHIFMEWNVFIKNDGHYVKCGIHDLDKLWLVSKSNHGVVFTLWVCHFFNFSHGYNYTINRCFVKMTKWLHWPIYTTWKKMKMTFNLQNECININMCNTLQNCYKIFHNVNLLWNDYFTMSC